MRIAVVDTGIDAGPPDLAGKVLAAANFTGSDTTQDLSGHGTHVAGVAAASFDNSIGIAGMAPDARLMDIKVVAVDQTGRTTGDCADGADRVVWATDHGANVLNLSLASPTPCLALELTVQYATSHGALVVAAAGNAGSTSAFCPAAFPDVLSVAATTNQDQLAGFSNRGASWVDVAAPGDGIDPAEVRQRQRRSRLRLHGWHVDGVAGRVRNRRPDLGPDATGGRPPGGRSPDFRHSPADHRHRHRLPLRTG